MKVKEYLALARFCNDIIIVDDDSTAGFHRYSNVEDIEIMTVSYLNRDIDTIMHRNDGITVIILKAGRLKPWVEYQR